MFAGPRPSGWTRPNQAAARGRRLVPASARARERQARVPAGRGRAQHHWVRTLRRSTTCSQCPSSYSVLLYSTLISNYDSRKKYRQQNIASKISPSKISPCKISPVNNLASQ